VARCRREGSAEKSAALTGGRRRTAAAELGTRWFTPFNGALGNIGNAVYYTEPVEANPVNNLESLRELCADIDAGRSTLCFILSSNPIYDAPHDFDFTSKLRKVPHTVHLSSHFNETSEHCAWHVAESHYLETWGDARCFRWYRYGDQPLIAPLITRARRMKFWRRSATSPAWVAYDAVRNRLKAANPSGDFEKFWRKTLNDGVVANTAYSPLNLTPKFSAASLPTIPPPNPRRT